MASVSAVGSSRRAPAPELRITPDQLKFIRDEAKAQGVRLLRDLSNLRRANDAEYRYAYETEPSLEGLELIAIDDPRGGPPLVMQLGEGEPMEPIQRGGRRDDVEEEEPIEPVMRRGRDDEDMEPIVRGRGPDSVELEERDIRPVGGRGSPRQPEPEMQRRGLPQLDDVDMNELYHISRDKSLSNDGHSTVSLGRDGANVREPTADERAFARAHRPFLKRDAERRERLVVIDDGRNDPLIVSFKEKQTLGSNFWSTTLHAVGAIPSAAPGFGLVQSALGIGTIAAGLFGPLAKKEHNLQLIRTGVKHALWGVANFALDAVGLYPVRLAATAAGAVLDIVQGATSLKGKADADVIPVDKKPTFMQKLGASLDYVAAAIRQLFTKKK